MCTFHSDRAVEVCDIAIGPVKAKLATEMGDVVHFTHLEGQPTLVEAAPSVDAEHFRKLVNAGIAEAAAGWLD